MKKHNKSISKPRMALLLGLAIVGLGATFVFANSILNKKHPVSNVTDVLGTTTNPYYDVKIVGNQVIPAKSTDGNNISRVNLQIGVTNKMATTLQISPGLQMFITSNTGAIYPFTARYTEPGVVIGGPLAANSYTLLNADFDIPATENTASFSFQEDLSKPIVTIKL